MRKRIAVFSGGWSGEFLQEVLAGVIRVANEQDVDVLTFLNFSIRMNLSNINDPEFSIFTLPDMRNFDGVILLGNSFNRQEEIDYLVEQVRKYKIPCFSVEYPIEGIPYISTDNYSGMHELAIHMLKTHKITKPLYISGPENHPEAVERLRAFMDAMAERNLEIPEKGIAYGDWSKEVVPTAIETYREAHAGQYPEAVICANDIMAISAYSHLKNMGLSIPEDVKVTGYDCIRLGQIQTPPLSSVNHEWNRMGIVAMERLMDLMRGEEIPLHSTLNTTFVCGGSCGCHVVNSLLGYNRLDRALTTNYMDPVDMDSHFRHFYSTVRKPHSVQELNKSLSDLFENEHLIEGDDFKLCLDPGFFRLKGQEQDLVEKKNRDYYDVIVGLNKGKRENYRQLSRNDCIFESCSRNETAGYYLFMPLSSEGKIFGFAMLTGALNVANESQFYIWTRHMDTALEQVRSNLLLAQLWDELMKQSVTDALTGVYNRHGCEMHTYPKLIEWTKQGGVSAIMLVDVDHMKIINDGYGHSSGDEALEMVTSAMRLSLPDTFTISRFGGDEFFVGGTLSDPNMDMEQLVLRMEQSLADQVARSHVKFPLTMSIGYAKIRPTSNVDIEKAIAVADEGMYIQKKKHHKGEV